ncbi:ABC transporter substrate-binding protein [Pseudonocardia sp. KRD291]|uniref:ABC transporter substrate-binding protein n=1 Tax=Pseudonocardia sp. KRD291 TaxID=2792007 RepID=UPI001C4A5012|nr:ABC transporter substrate-binding protein [Pseudonocardia sp. KRD291]MBW0102413.1 ABC transporter substrate-binding protein [Pseudonocardia sp. KRD291]
MSTRSRGRAARPAAIAIAAALALSVAACGGAPAETGAPDAPVTFGVTGPELPGSAYYSSIPTSLGYWSDQGLNVKFNEFKGTGEVMTAVATGKTTIGSGGTSGVMAAHVNGGADIKTFYSYIPNNPYWPVVLPDSQVRSLADLQGKTVGTFSLAGDGAGLLQGVMREQGLDADSMNIVEVGTGATALQALQTGRIAAYMGYDSVYAEIEGLGNQLRKVDSAIDRYGFLGGIVARPESFAEQRDVLVKLGRGIAEGSTFVKANPECALRVHWATYPQSKPAGVPEAEALRRGVTGVMARLKNQFPVDGQWGRVAPETVRKRIDVAVTGGTIRKPVAADEIWTPELLDEINAFDKAKVEQQARTCDLPTLVKAQ